MQEQIIQKLYQVFGINTKDMVSCGTNCNTITDDKIPKIMDIFFDLGYDLSINKLNDGYSICCVVCDIVDYQREADTILNTLLLLLIDLESNIQKQLIQQLFETHN